MTLPLSPTLAPDLAIQADREAIVVTASTSAARFGVLVPGARCSATLGPWVDGGRSYDSGRATFPRFSMRWSPERAISSPDAGRER